MKLNDNMNIFTVRKKILLAILVPNSGQYWLYRKSDYPEYFKESQ